MRNLLLTRSVLCLCILFILTITSCRKEILAPENIIQPVTLKEAKQWVDEHPLAQIVALDWEKARQAGKKHEVIHVPVTPEDRLSQIRNSDTKAAINSLITGSIEPRGNTSEPTPANPNYDQDHPPAILFQKDSAGNVRAFMYNFIPADKNKENGKDGLWTGKLYQWNMKGDTVLVRKLNKSQPEEIYFEASKRTTTNSTAFSRLSATRPDNDMSSIWSWLRGILSGIWEAIAVLAYQLGITSTVPPNSWTWNNNRWSDNEGGNEQTISYIGNDPVGYTFYLSYGGGSYQAPTLSSVDLLMMRLGNQDDAVAQFVESYEYQSMASQFLTYLNNNNNSAASIDFVKWAIEHLMVNSDVDLSELMIANNIPNSSINLPALLDTAGLSNYPSFKKIVSDMPTFLSEHPDVLRSLSRYTGFSKAKIMELMLPGKGPKIELIFNLETNGMPATGKYYPGSNTLQIRKELVIGLDKVQNPNRYAALGMLLAVTTLHEFVHYGRDVNKLTRRININGVSYESGLMFELSISPPYNYDYINRNNAIQWANFYNFNIND